MNRRRGQIRLCQEPEDVLSRSMMDCGPALLVGHSYGGSVITAAGTADNVVGLVCISGFAPRPTAG